MQYIAEIRKALEEGMYCPQAVRRVYIPKGGGKMRPLGIPTIKDRIVQAAIKQAIEPIYEREFLDMSYGFRPGRGAKDALRAVDQAVYPKASHNIKNIIHEKRLVNRGAFSLERKAYTITFAPQHREAE